MRPLFLGLASERSYRLTQNPLCEALYRIAHPFKFLSCILGFSSERLFKGLVDEEPIEYELFSFGLLRSLV